jgi:hypothetical protein
MKTKPAHQFLPRYDRKSFMQKIKNDAEITLATLFSNVSEITSIL